MKQYFIIAGLLILMAGMAASAEIVDEGLPWSIDTDCEQKQIQSLKAAANATTQADAELSLLKAEAYGQLKHLVPQC